MSNADLESADFDVLDDGELRWLRKQLSMDQAATESRIGHASGETRDRLISDLRHCQSVYDKVNSAVTRRLLGESDA